MQLTYLLENLNMNICSLKKQLKLKHRIYLFLNMLKTYVQICSFRGGGGWCVDSPLFGMGIISSCCGQLDKLVSKIERHLYYRTFNDNIKFISSVFINTMKSPLYLKKNNYKEGQRRINKSVFMSLNLFMSVSGRLDF